MYKQTQWGFELGIWGFLIAWFGDFRFIKAPTI